MRRRRRHKRFSRRHALAAIALALLAHLGGLLWFAEGIPRTAIGEPEPTDAIVVLTGGPLRLKEGLTLLSEARGKKLFVSGVNPDVDMGELLRVAGQAPAEFACCVALGYAADNTAGNAVETRKWMDEEGYRSLRLVTASYHMRRSLLEFHRAMPDIRIIPHPVFPDQFKRDEWWQWPGTLALIVQEYHKYLAALARAQFLAYLGVGAQDA